MCAATLCALFGRDRHCLGYLQQVVELQSFQAGGIEGSAFVAQVLSYGRAAAPVVAGFVQPLSAAYPKSLASRAGELLEENRRRPLFLLEAGDYVAIPPEELPDLESLRNFNTPEEYLSALRESGATGSVTVEFLGIARQKAGMASMGTQPDSLQNILQSIETRCPGLPLSNGGNPSAHFLFSLDGVRFVRELGFAFGPGDRLIVMDAATGG